MSDKDFLASNERVSDATLAALIGTVTGWIGARGRATNDHDHAVLACFIELRERRAEVERLKADCKRKDALLADVEAVLVRQRDERLRLQAALIRVRAHTAHNPQASAYLLAGLLVSIEHIVERALGPAAETKGDAT